MWRPERITVEGSDTRGGVRRGGSGNGWAVLDRLKPRGRAPLVVEIGFVPFGRAGNRITQVARAIDVCRTLRVRRQRHHKASRHQHAEQDCDRPRTATARHFRVLFRGFLHQCRPFLCNLRRVRQSGHHSILPSWDPGPPPARTGRITDCPRADSPLPAAPWGRIRRQYPHERRSSSSNGCHGALQPRWFTVPGEVGFFGNEVHVEREPSRRPVRPFVVQYVDVVDGRDG